MDCFLIAAGMFLQLGGAARMRVRHWSGSSGGKFQRSTTSIIVGVK
jgi:hypothetical protein